MEAEQHEGECAVEGALKRAECLHGRECAVDMDGPHIMVERLHDRECVLEAIYHGGSAPW